MTDIDRFFQSKLMFWSTNTPRHMPWRGERDPYKIWLSEIILQQTRVQQGWTYYEKFIAAFPSIENLAIAPENEIMKLWEGLGYYSRAKNLHHTAKYIFYTLKGGFPKTYKELIALKGIGPYTAAAIASFAFDLPYAVIDGNVIRVLTRYYGIKTPIHTSEAKKKIAQIAQNLIPQESPALYNQAIMDFGALICTPKKVQCATCILSKNCIAYKENSLYQIPVKRSAKKKRKRYFHFLVIYDKNHILIKKRENKDIWQGLYAFVTIEKPRLYGKEIIPKEGLENSVCMDISSSYKQILSHQIIESVFFKIKLAHINKNLYPHYERVPIKDRNEFAFPSIINRYLKDFCLS